MNQDYRCENRLLSKFDPLDYGRVLECSRRVTVGVGEIACEPGTPIRYIQFPMTGILSTVVNLQNGDMIEAATIGNEGMAGLSAIIDERASPYRITQRVEGEVLQIPVADFRSLLSASRRAREVVGRYTLTLLQQYAQNAACNLHHKIDERMCRWLLTTSDRVGRDGFEVTQEFLSEMLGVSRQSINMTACVLQQEGMISYRRGKLRITDRVRLEDAACECYRVTKETYKRLMQLN